MADERFFQDGLENIMKHTGEECTELAGAIFKTQRWGMVSYDPTIPPEQRITNAQWIRREIADLRRQCDHLEEAMIMEGYLREDGSEIPYEEIYP